MFWSVYRACALGSAVARKLEGVLVRRDGHDGRVDQTELHDPSIETPQ